MDTIVRTLTFVLTIQMITSSDLECQMELKPYKLQPLYRLNSKNVVTIGRQIRIRSAYNCHLNSEAIINDYNFPNESITTALFKFICDEYIKISFDQLENATYHSNLISYIQLDKCSFDPREIDLFFLITNARVFVILTANFTSFEATAYRSSCEGFKNILSLALTSIHNDIMSFIQYMFNCNNETFNVKEVLLGQCIGAIHQQQLRKKFPDLQTLEVLNCDIKNTVEFPWSIRDAFLPDNISRSEYLQNHISTSYHLNIPYDIFRRHLSLTNNGLTTGSDIQISRRLHFFKISQNNISLFDEDVFKNVEGLQFIILSELGLQEIRGLTFSGLTELLYLDLTKNKLSNLPPGVFDQLSSLIILSLAHNSLNVLPKQVFLYLNKLISLDLGYNKILTVGDEILPVNSVALQRINLNNNPIREFPVTLLYIRGLETIDLPFTNISFQNMNFLEIIDETALVRSVEQSRSSIERTYLETTDNWREINLQQSNVTGFFITNNVSSHAKEMLLIILKHYKFIFTMKSFNCYSDIMPFNELMQNLYERGVWKGNEYFYTDWICKVPLQFNERTVLSLKAEDTYSIVDISECPNLCACYIREVFNVTIVNCRHKRLNTLPKSMPTGMLDLWLENNNISKLTVRKYLGDVRQLLMSNNQLVKIEPEVFTKMMNLKMLKLDNNLLIRIPERINELNIDMIFLKNNPFACDCHALWSKKWLKTNSYSIDNLREVTCFNENHQEAQQIVNFKDYKFVCKEGTIYRSYVTPVVVGTALLILVGIIVIMIIYFREEIRVLLYVTFELHPFDRRKCDKREVIDLAIIYTKDSEEFVEEKSVLPLKRLQFVIFSVAHDFIAGYSLQENVSSAVFQSKHVLLILSDDMMSNTVLMDYTWAECQNKIKVNRANFLLVTNVTKMTVFPVLNKDIQKHIRLHKHLNCTGALFFSKIKYILRSYSKNNIGTRPGKQMIDISPTKLFPFNRELQITIDNEYDLFFCYSSDERDYCQNNLIPRLERESYRICTPDSHFHSGACILTNIGLVVESSSHTVFVTSSFNSFDDLQLFVFQRAIEKTRLQKYNHLIVVFMQINGSETEDRDVKDYLNSYAYLDVRDRLFFTRLKRALKSQIKVDLSNIHILSTKM
ncbi:toll-like receptor 6 [Mytilus californianus]|uniref:toll-like receptor 6 n=1 Tax=Mytilus californianus TaxID=6549 RepID=UPI00224727A9|nr:toll-like receptor 6 [Mytilus californianus]